MVLAAQSLLIRQQLQKQAAERPGNKPTLDDIVTRFSAECMELVLRFCYDERLDSVLKVREQEQGGWKLVDEFLDACDILGLGHDDSSEEGAEACERALLNLHTDMTPDHPLSKFFPLSSVELELDSARSLLHAGLEITIRHAGEQCPCCPPRPPSVYVEIRRRVQRSLRPVRIYMELVHCWGGRCRCPDGQRRLCRQKVSELGALLTVPQHLVFITHKTQLVSVLNPCESQTMMFPRDDRLVLDFICSDGPEAPSAAQPGMEIVFNDPCFGDFQVEAGEHSPVTFHVSEWRIRALSELLF